MRRLILALVFFNLQIALSQVLSVHKIESADRLSIDGQLNEIEWVDVDSILLTMVEPKEGEEPAFPTIIKVLADDSNIILGIKCEDSEPAKIISYSKSRDALLSHEDRIKFVFDTYLNNRSGYIFAVNPTGTRYDALVADFGESENPNWDGNWIAESVIDSTG